MGPRPSLLEPFSADFPVSLAALVGSDPAAVVVDDFVVDALVVVPLVGGDPALETDVRVELVVVLDDAGAVAEETDEATDPEPLVGVTVPT